MSASFILVAIAAVLALTGSTAAEPTRDRLSRVAQGAKRVERAVLLNAAVIGTRIVAVGERGIVALSDDSGLTWRQAAQVPSSVTLTSVKFATPMIGWAVGHGGVVLRTTDGGERWVAQLDGLKAAHLALQQALAQSGDKDAGKRLQDAELLVTDGADKPFLDIECLDEQRVIVVGAYGLIFASTDGGTNWTPWMGRLDNPKGLHLYSIRKSGEKLVLVGEQGLVLHSGNAGTSFSRWSSPYAGSWFSLALTRDGDFVVAGLRGNAYRVSDDGKSWQHLEGATPSAFTSVVPYRDDCLLLTNQAGQVFSLRSGQNGLQRLAVPALAPVTGITRLASGSWLALTAQGPADLGLLESACGAPTSGQKTNP